MATKQHKTYIVSLPKSNLDQSLDDVLLSPYSFEFIDVNEIDEGWEVQEFHQDSDYSQELKVVNFVLDKWKKTGLFASVVDQRYRITKADIDQAYKNWDSLWHNTEVLAEYYDTKHKLEELKGFKKNRKFAYIVGHQLEAFQKEVRDESLNIMEEFNAAHPQEKIDIPETIFPSKIVHLGELELLEYSRDDSELVDTFLKDHLHVKLYDEYLQHIIDTKTLLKKKCADFNVDPEKPSKDVKKELAAFYVIISLHEKKSSYYRNIHSLSASSKDIFFFVHTDAPQDALISLLPEMGALEEVDYDQTIIDWKSSGSLESFRGIVASMGTIEQGEADPTGVLAIFFMIFFAFCLGDGFYGLIIALITGYFLFFTRIKKNLKGMFNLFFFSGLASVIFGALTNSWAGDLFSRGPLGEYTQYFQVIDLLDSSSYTPPVNQFLNDTVGVSPIVAMLALTVVIGIIHIFVAYLLKIKTNIGQKKPIQALQTVVWMLFLFTLVVSIITGAWYLVGAGALLLFLVQEGGIVSKFSGLFGQIYGLVSLFSDILSYTRLIAVGLTSGIIAQVVNLLAELAYDSSPAILNVVLLVSILVIGHVFNLVVALFGAYINPLRLHYVEFMPKFFQGTARAFNPVDNSFEYAEIVQPRTSRAKKQKQTIQVQSNG